MGKSVSGLLAHTASKIGKRYQYAYTGIVTLAVIKAKAIQYPETYTAKYTEDSKKNIGYWATDCSGLVDEYLGIDTSAEGYYQTATKKGKISEVPIPEVKGILLFIYSTRLKKMGHVGVYIGNGEVDEARSLAFGVVRTKVKGRGWTHWGYCNLIDYATAPVSQPASANPQEVSEVLTKGQPINEDVKALQRGLNSTGYGYNLDPDGDYGDLTEKAAANFKYRHSNSVDGKVFNHDDMSALLNVLAQRPPVVTTVEKIVEKIVTVRDETLQALVESQKKELAAVAISMDTLNAISGKY